MDLIEYPIEIKQPNKIDNIIKLGLDPNYKNIINIGLFTWGKNQGYAFEIARTLEQYKIMFHFIGNQAINPYQTQALLGRTSYAYDNTAGYGYRPNSIGNPDLRWETSTTANLGLDFSFFSGRINGSAEYYNTTTTDLLAPQPLPTSTGFGGFITNVGSTQNRGVELTLSTVNVDKGGFTWETDLIFNKNTEAILELANGKVDDIAAGRFIGKPLTVFFDYKNLFIS